MATQRSVMAVIRAARPTFRNAHDKVAFAIHASFLASGYVLLATGRSAFSDDALSSTSTEEVGIDQWNAMDDNYGFVYSIPDNDSKRVLVKCLAMNHYLLVDALTDGPDSVPVHLSLNVGGFDREDGGTNYGSKYKNFEELVSDVEREILSKLNDASTETPSTQASSSGTRELAATELRCPHYHRAGIMYPLVTPLFVGPAAGMYPNSGPFGTGGGMTIGPDYRLFDWMNVSIYTALPDFGLGQQPSVPPLAPWYPLGPPRFPRLDRNLFTRNSCRSIRGTSPDQGQNRGG